MDWAPTHPRPSSLPSAVQTPWFDQSASTDSASQPATTVKAILSHAQRRSMENEGTGKTASRRAGLPDAPVWLDPTEQETATGKAIPSVRIPPGTHPWHPTKAPPLTMIDLHEADSDKDTADPLFQKRPSYPAELHLDQQNLQYLDTGLLRHRLADLQFLSARKNRLEAWPDQNDLRQMRSLNVLAFEDNQLSSVPLHIDYLAELRCLSLSNNKITSLPSTISALTNLQALYVDGNELERLPELNLSISDVDASRNRIKLLPLNIHKLTKLKSLRISNNILFELPPTLGFCTSLSHLDLSSNKLFILPYEVNKLTNLMHLNINNNKIKILHPDILSLRHIKEFTLFENPLVFPPPDIVKEGFYSVMNYLASFDRLTGLILRGCEGTLPAHQSHELQHLISTLNPTLVKSCYQRAKDLFIEVWGSTESPEDLPVLANQYNLEFGLSGKLCPQFCPVTDCIHLSNTTQSDLTYTLLDAECPDGVSLTISEKSGCISAGSSTSIRFILHFTSELQFRQVRTILIEDKGTPIRSIYIHFQIFSEEGNARVEADIDIKPRDLEIIGLKQRTGKLIEYRRAKWKGNDVMVKLFVNQGENSVEWEVAMRDELHFASKAHHPRILHLLGACLLSPRPCLVYEYPEKWNLEDFLVSNTNLPNITKLQFSLDVIWAIRYMHLFLPTWIVIQRELRTDCFMVDRDTNVKLADFRLSAAGWRTNHCIPRSCGCCFLPPEVSFTHQYSHESDVYSIGVVLFQIFTGKKPHFLDDQEVTTHDLYGKSPEPIQKRLYRRPIIDILPGSISVLEAWQKELVESCWSVPLSQRPSLDMIISKMIREDAKTAQVTYTNKGRHSGFSGKAWPILRDYQRYFGIHATETDTKTNKNDKVSPKSLPRKPASASLQSGNSDKPRANSTSKISNGDKRTPPSRPVTPQQSRKGNSANFVDMMKNLAAHSEVSATKSRGTGLVVKGHKSALGTKKLSVVSEVNQASEVKRTTFGREVSVHGNHKKVIYDRHFALRDTEKTAD